MFTVFIGSSLEAKPYAEVVTELISENSMFKAIPWWHRDVTQYGSSFLESLFELLPQTNFGIFVATPDDLLLKRDKEYIAIRDNVLFEYGLFAGYLGRHNTVLFQIGETEVPSDLRGITVVHSQLTNSRTNKDRKNRLRGKVEECLDKLLQSVQDEYEVALSELRDGSPHLKASSLLPLLANVMHQRINKDGKMKLSAEHLRILLEKYRCKEERIVGLREHPTKLEDFIDFSQIDYDDLSKLTDSYARFVANHLLNPCEGEVCATRIALHYKRDLKFLSEVIKQLRVRPAIVDLNAQTLNKSVKGHYIRGESAILLHDFTTTGFTPLSCISKLKEQDVITRKIVSFFVREENLESLRSICNHHRLDFQVFCIQKSTGELEIAGKYE
jgi:hypothetical protein